MSPIDGEARRTPPEPEETGRPDAPEVPAAGPIPAGEASEKPEGGREGARPSEVAEPGAVPEATFAPAAPATEPPSPAREVAAVPAGTAPPAAALAPVGLPVRARRRLGFLAERPEAPVEVPRRRLAAQTRRDFLLFGAGLVGAAAAAWWLLPERAKSHLLPRGAHDRLDTLAARVGLSRDRRERVLDGALTFDDDVAEALYSRDRRVRTYARSQVTPLRNNYNGQTPGPEYLAAWTLRLSGLASGREETLTLAQLLRRFVRQEETTRLVCVEGWSAIAWWGGIRFADLLAAFPPAPSARWASLRSAVNLDEDGNSDPYYVSLDLGTARHPQTLLATHKDGEPLTVAHGAPLRLVAPMKLGLKNIKAVTAIAYGASEPPDYWNERGYSKYDGL